MNPNKRHFGKALKSYIEEKGITKAWLAKKLGMTGQSLQAAFKVEYTKPDNLAKYLDALGINEDELYASRDSTEEVKNVEPKESIQVVQIALTEFNFLMQQAKEVNDLKDELLRMKDEKIKELEKHNRVDSSPAMKH